MEIFENHPLKDHNTFGINVMAKFFARISRQEDLTSILSDSDFSGIPCFVLGGGSNVLFRKNFDGLVLHVDVRGREIFSEDANSLVIALGSGENWHQQVEFCIAREWGGIENLSLIPGNCGAAPIQNIGAYGVELSDVFEWLEALDLQTGAVKKFSRDDCRFAYRDSVFKNEYKGRYLITRIAIRLQKNPVLNTAYGVVESELIKSGKEKREWTIGDVSEAVVKIRRSKLPDPAELGNAGSFFKNPAIGSDVVQLLKGIHPDIPSYADGKGNFRIAAGWLIEKAGWKGFRSGECGVHEKQALVLVNFGRAGGDEIFELSEKIREDVLMKFGIGLQREVEVV